MSIPRLGNINDVNGSFEFKCKYTVGENETEFTITPKIIDNDYLSY